MSFGTEIQQAFTNHPGRDTLAAERTRLANDRTFLAYQRTALTLFVAGLTFIRFFNNFIIGLIGWLFLPAGLITVALGIYRYRQTRNNIRETLGNSSRPPQK